MGLRTMASPNGAQVPEFPHGLLSHSLEEFQNYYAEHGKPLHKMNMEELADAVQQFQTTTSPSTSSSTCIAPPLPADCNLNTPFIHKAVQEVLHDVTGKEGHASEKRLAVLGENTLENFIKAGAINPGYGGWSRSVVATEPGVHQRHKWIQYEEEASKQQEQQSMGFLGGSLPMFESATVNACFSKGPKVGMPVGSVALAKPTSSDSQMLEEINRNDEIVDKSIERRQKRMIKNRESAARSRARKQAYIIQLEDKVKKLEATNIWLRRQLEKLSHCDPEQVKEETFSHPDTEQKNKEMLSHPDPEPKNKHRPSNSSSI